MKRQKWMERVEDPSSGLDEGQKENSWNREQNKQRRSHKDV